MHRKLLQSKVAAMVHGKEIDKPFKYQATTLTGVGRADNNVYDLALHRYYDMNTCICYHQISWQSNYIRIPYIG